MEPQGTNTREPRNNGSPTSCTVSQPCPTSWYTNAYIVYSDECQFPGSPFREFESGSSETQPHTVELLTSPSLQGFVECKQESTFPACLSSLNHMIAGLHASSVDRNTLSEIAAAGREETPRNTLTDGDLPSPMHLLPSHPSLRSHPGTLVRKV